MAQSSFTQYKNKVVEDSSPLQAQHNFKTKIMFLKADYCLILLKCSKRHLGLPKFLAVNWLQLHCEFPYLYIRAHYGPWLCKNVAFPYIFLLLAIVNHDKIAHSVQFHAIVFSWCGKLKDDVVPNIENKYVWTAKAIELISMVKVQSQNSSYFHRPLGIYHLLSIVLNTISKLYSVLNTEMRNGRAGL